ncbi:hypothetical protein [Acetobacter persici]|uniref:Lysozyme inhibitor LprI N-terminal domain-containing protein n=1 Tax=Acetobacter persici TaxID=1076596 RepID=A0A1U9LG99_9PROT|nr:hypothetical protein [Acetobacter persici]AQT05474.1 hypothetical protein A0U91_12125 [Acetobacter persici]
MTHLSLSLRPAPVRCTPFVATVGLGLLLAGGPARAATPAAHGAKDARQTWALAECMSMVEEDPFGARDYAQDWLKHGGDREARHCHALALLELGMNWTRRRNWMIWCAKRRHPARKAPPACGPSWRKKRLKPGFQPGIFPVP